jgi:hypothetical protein
MPGPAGSSTSAEVFRLRDAAGNVIGLASRATTMVSVADGRPVQGTDWMLFVPSRGSLFLRQLNAVDAAPRSPASGGEPVPAPDTPGFWSAGTRLRMNAGPQPDGAGQVVQGTEEFAGLRGGYEEAWELAEVAADGATRGRITISTRTMAGP